jgi:hypothetical protein
MFRSSFVDFDPIPVGGVRWGLWMVSGQGGEGGEKRMGNRGIRMERREHTIRMN